MWHWGWGWGHGLYGLPYWWIGGLRIVVIAVVITGVVYLVRILSRQGRGRGEESALNILEKRYARGEITKEQYEEMKRDLS